MPNILDASGLQVASRAELVAYMTAQFQQIYGADINLASDTPDGQLLNLFVQMVLDDEDLLVQINSMFDPDNAVGVILDQRCAINGLQRQGGTKTVTPVTVVITQSINLYGLDQTAQPVYTVSDNAGSLWQLQTSQIGVGPGTFVYQFQAAIPGAQLTTPNTITTQVTTVLGVASVNNPTTYTTLGVDEESDANLRLRRQKSVSLASQGYLAGLLAALENIPGVSSAFVYENTTGATNSDGVPSHSIWVIVAGSGAAAAIAQAIYTKRNAGCGMFGSNSYTITQVDGSPFTVYWDDVTTRTLYTAFTATSINGVAPPNIAAIRTGLVTQFTPTVFQEVNINGLATVVQEIDPNCLVTNAGFSLGTLQTMNLSGVAASGQVVLNYNGNASAAIMWNDTASAVQAKLQAVLGLTNALVTGSFSGQSFALDLSHVGDVLSLITATGNTLQTSGAMPIAVSFDEHYTPTLLPPSKANEFVVEAPDIIIVAMQLTPPTSQVATTQTKQFTALGGYGAYTYSISINNSGGSISGSGLYTAGATPSVTDTVKATDAFGNTATATVSVV